MDMENRGKMGGGRERWQNGDNLRRSTFKNSVAKEQHQSKNYELASMTMLYEWPSFGLLYHLHNMASFWVLLLAHP
jgi:hypothetical protein